MHSNYGPVKMENHCMENEEMVNDAEMMSEREMLSDSFVWVSNVE